MAPSERATGATPRLVHPPEELRAACEAARRAGQRVAVVPTMGALHAGHVALMHEARRRADFVVVTIFVNPTQFGPTEDLAKYPRTLPADVAACAGAGVDVVFAPEASAMYPEGDATRVRVLGITEALCGVSRPVHFEGVATVVTKLFALVGPSVAVFGRKDYQQLCVVRRLARDLLLPVEVVGHPTVREGDGLALSSRNVYLSAAERTAARAIPRALAGAAARFAAGERSVEALVGPVEGALAAAGLRLDYATLADADTVRPFERGALVPERALLAVAAFAGTTRLIDNLVLGEEPAPEAGGLAFGDTAGAPAGASGEAPGAAP